LTLLKCRTKGAASVDRLRAEDTDDYAGSSANPEPTCDLDQEIPIMANATSSRSVLAPRAKELRLAPRRDDFPALITDDQFKRFLNDRSHDELVKIRIATAFGRYSRAELTEKVRPLISEDQAEPFFSTLDIVGRVIDFCRATADIVSAIQDRLIVVADDILVAEDGGESILVPDTWAVAVEAEERSKEEMERHHAERVAPINRAHDAGMATYDQAREAEERWGEVVSAHHAALKALMAAPAPSLNGILYKIETGQNAEIFSCGSHAAQIAVHLAEDLRRMGASADREFAS
jgi:hypothetical protein